MKKRTEILFELILINLFILNLAIGTISNFSLNIFLLKALSSFLLVVAAVIVFKIEKSGIRYPTTGIPQGGGQQPASNIQHPNFSKGLKQLTLILIVFITYLSLTLIYSSNPLYGFQKILNFFISVIPSIIVFYYLLSTLTEQRIKLFIYSVAAISVVTVVYVFLVYPFNQAAIYHYRPGRWSHVIYGRMISSFAVVLLLYLSTHKEKKQVLLYGILTAIAIYGTYLSALRAAILGLVLIIVVLMILSGISKIKNWGKGEKVAIETDQSFQSNFQFSGLMITILITVVIIILMPGKHIITERVENMISIEGLDFEGDSAIHSRLDSWSLSWQIIKEHPVIGIGFGGFNGYNNIEWTDVIKYPHNIFLEMTVEGGVIGLLVLGSLFVVMFRNIYRYSFYFFPLIYFLFALFLAMFSKDVSSQSVLWIGLAYVGIKDND